MKAVVTSISLAQDSDVSHARRAARLIAKVGDAPSRDQIRFATAVSEIARNALQYAEGGVAEFSFDESALGLKLLARIHDKGTGISDIDSMLRGRHQSHKGPGLGLNGSRKLVDDFVVETGRSGTLIDLTLNLKSTLAPVKLAQSAAEALVQAAHGSPVEELSEQNRALRDALAEQQFLLREMHHRTKNNLAIIQSLALLQARQSANEETKTALTELTGRIQAFANAHNLLHQADDVSRVDLKAHIETLAERLRVAFDEGGLTIDIDCEPLTVSFDTATEVGLIVNELLTNARKYASGDAEAERKVEVSAEKRDEQIMLCVKDNGPGLPKGADSLKKSRSLGWKVIEGCVRKINGTIEVDGSDGLAVTIAFRDSDAEQ
ncbi:histidine kinase dimerization/phosphoacceptor domain -containing protein [Fulvimarina sp. MAC8]|uniref:histidine kinase dimerization/phosphoacceptor domain -containing protein n=1 Tax=Fulvimarina sp. MAC8 TaxID=3162874 RepID=UPI0032EF2C35